MIPDVMEVMIIDFQVIIKRLAIQGVEPWTFALLARRSNQLSYTAMYYIERLHYLFSEQPVFQFPTQSSIL